jgi:monofunctional glycosyltransferase
MTPRSAKSSSRSERLWPRLLGLALLAALALVAWEAARWPDVRALAARPPASTAFIDRYRAMERRAGRTPRVQWTWVAYGRIAPALKHAVVVAEDASFFSHRGFAADEIREALDKAVKELDLPRGASTITQQLAKNLLLSGERNFVRKGQEVVLAFALERMLSKQRILEIYLNNVEWGEGVFGAEAAARHYFRIGAHQLGATQAARLAVMLPAPKRFEKRPDSAYVGGRAAVIAARMADVELP